MIHIYHLPQSEQINANNKFTITLNTYVSA